MSSEKRVDIHKFITTVYNPQLNEFILSPSDGGMRQSVSEGRIIYSKNLPNITTEGYPLYLIRDDLFRLGASQSTDFLVNEDAFLQSLEPLYQYFLKNRGTHLSNKIDSVLRSADTMLENDYFATKIAKNEKIELEAPLITKPKSQVEKKFFSTKNTDSWNEYNKLPQEPSSSRAKLPRLNISWSVLGILRKPFTWYIGYGVFVFYLLFTPLSSHGWITSTIQNILFVISIVYGLYPAYWLMKRVDRMHLNSDLKIWGLRIASGLVLIGSFFFFLMGFAFSWTEVTMKGTHGEGYILNYFVSAFAFGLMIASGFMLFKFRRSSGYIVYTR